MKIDYDSENDILFIHKGFPKGEYFDGNLVLSDFVFDISSKKKVCGVEILNASKNLQSFGVDSAFFSELNSADFKADVLPECVSLKLKLTSRSKMISVELVLDRVCLICQ